MFKFEDNFFDDLLENCGRKITKEVENITSELDNEIASKFNTFPILQMILLKQDVLDQCLLLLIISKSRINLLRLRLVSPR